MLLRLESLQKMPLVCLDGKECGTIEDFLFDEEYGTVRFVSLITGPESEPSSMLIAARALRLRGERLEVGYRSDALRGGADGRPRQPTSPRPHRVSGGPARSTRLRTPGFALPPAVPRTSLQRSAHNTSRASTSHRPAHDAPQVRLRSFQDLRLARVLTDDGNVGRLDDFVVSQDNWTLRHLVVALDSDPSTTRDPGPFDGPDTAHERERVLVGLSWVRRIDWDTPSLHVDLPREQLRASPRLESHGVVPHEFERQVYDFHGRR